MKILNQTTRAKDIAVYCTYLSKMCINTAGMALDVGPIAFARALKKMPWMMGASKILDSYNIYVLPRKGRYREANAAFIATLMTGVGKSIGALIKNPEKSILYEDLCPPEIPYAMGLNAWAPELFAFLLPIIDSFGYTEYIDACENEGIPPDVCSVPKGTMGIALKGHMPSTMAIVSSNSPCDGGMASYMLFEKEFKTPAFRMDYPYNFKSNRAVTYFVEELKSMITWLEKNTPGRMDWELLALACKERNRMVEAELELWDLVCHKPAPMAGEAIYLSHLMAYNLRPWDPELTKMYKNLGRLAKENLDNNTPALPDERHRILLWGPFPPACTNLFPWAEKTYGAALVMDSLSFNRIGFIDTKTPETMLEGLAKTILAGPMARHSRGVAQNFFDDLFFAYDKFGANMLWVGGHIGCKNAQALNGILRRKCRDRNIPVLIINYDMSDPRIVPEQQIKAQVEGFMENIMGASKLG